MSSHLGFLTYTGCSDRPRARDGDGFSYVGAELRSIRRSISTSLGKAKIRFAKVLPSALRGVLRGENL